MAAHAIAVLAAGLGTRMKSGLPKVLHHLYGQPLLAYVLRTALSLAAERLLAVVGYREDLVRQAFAGWPVEWVSQPRQLGTGHAAMQAVEALRGYEGDVAVLMGDAVFLESDTLRRVFAEHRSARAGATVVTGVLEDPSGLGRILREADGRVKAIVEERDASLKEKAIREVNSGCYVFDYGRLCSALNKLKPDKQQNEYYLTDVVRMLVEEGDTVISVVAEDAREILGINTRAELAQAARLLQERTLKGLMLAGVTVVDPATTHVDPRARVSPDTVIEPFSILEGALVVEAGCHLGPYCHLVGRRSLDPPGGEPGGLPVVAAGTRLGRGCHVLGELPGTAGPIVEASKGAEPWTS
jgi:bifunctional UDP-N-acetylglucosamine pyrophosphorylase/glucosamine-1-phosphate N-acetyltransferase